MKLLETLKKFLYKNLNSKEPVLLAYSGGIDSSCLLDVILKCKNEIKIDLHVVHINHGWRKESEQEASMIKEKMGKLNIFFHYKKIKINSNKNLENEFRNERIKFFRFLYDKNHYQALILAHQKDDLAETVLKRVLEGASIFSLTSMKEVVKFQDMIVWRPFLKVSRKDILKYLSFNNIEYFKDKTNEDVKYLRAKMRRDIFPYLQKNFNKEITNNLVFLSSYSLEINNYLEKKTKPFLKNLSEGFLGVCIDLNEVNEFLEIKFIIKKIIISKNIDLSRDILNQLSFWLLEKKPNLRVKLKKANIFADRGYFFILKENFKILNKKILLNKNSFDYDVWQVNIKKVKKLEKNTSWKDFFQNKIFIYIPDDKYFICYPGQNKKLKKIWENNKVPSFLRKIIPIICNENKIHYEFLSGRKVQLNSSNILQISLKLK